MPISINKESTSFGVEQQPARTSNNAVLPIENHRTAADNALSQGLKETCLSEEELELLRIYPKNLKITKDNGLSEYTKGKARAVKAITEKVIKMGLLPWLNIAEFDPEKTSVVIERTQGGVRYVDIVYYRLPEVRQYSLCDSKLNPEKYKQLIDELRSKEYQAGNHEIGDEAVKSEHVFGGEIAVWGPAAIREQAVYANIFGDTKQTPRSVTHFSSPTTHAAKTTPISSAQHELMPPAQPNQILNLSENLNLVRMPALFKHSEQFSHHSAAAVLASEPTLKKWFGDWSNSISQAILMFLRIGQSGS